ncbi:MAG: dihydrofolate reductase [Angustibacter sp.]
MSRSHVRQGAGGRPVRLGLIWAQAHGGVIGANGTLPWHLPEDLVRFREVTMGTTVVMGRRTWESLPAQARPLRGRRNLVLSSDRAYRAEGAQIFLDLAGALCAAAEDGPVWVIGGAQAYAAALPLADQVLITEVDVEVAGDVRAPGLGTEWRLTITDPASGWHRSRTGLGYRFTQYHRPQR